jgi:ActR/RegA family two-component response regulator
MIVGMDGHTTGRCVVLGDHGAPATAALGRAIADAGLEVTAMTSRWPELLTAVVETSPDAVVIDLAMAGRAGVRLIAAVRALVPKARIAVLSDLRAAPLIALEAGATVVVDPVDLRPLVTALRNGEVARAQG